MICLTYTAKELRRRKAWLRDERSLDYDTEPALFLAEKTCRHSCGSIP
jgi:hypothetical protein